jgi:class 3 adenylate cyclase/tetratricopeptide (TPR) repeat protein
MPSVRDVAPQASRDRASDALAYVPRVLVESVARDPGRASPWHERIQGTLLMGDVSGFTAMSELLAKAGKEGAEWLTDIINSFFGSMLGVAREFGGDTMTFGGDAVLLLFRGDDHARRACAAALAMLDATEKLPAYKVGSHRVRLGMSMGAHSGEFFLGSAGLAESHLQCLLFGPGAARTCMAEAAANSGELLVTQETAAALAGAGSAEASDGFFRVLGVPRTADSGPAVDVDPTSVLPHLLQYLPPQVAAGLAAAAHPHEPESDHRKVCVAFINIMGVDELLESEGAQAVLRDLHGYVAAVVRLADRYGGCLISNDVYTHGLKLIVGFGAPVAHEHDTANALRMVAALRREAESRDLRLAHRAGVNVGFVFAGDVGPTYRRQYTVMGDAVNLAARLMSAASAGKTYVSRATLEEAGTGFATEELPPISVKGKQAPIRVCALTGECAENEVADGANTLVGRDGEARALERAAEEAHSGHGKVAVIRGEPGIGKSRLTQGLRQALEAREWVILLGGCQAHTSGQPFAPWTTVLHTLLGVDAGDDADTKGRRIRAAVRDLLPDSSPWSPLLGPLLGASLPDTEAVRALKEADRRSRLFDLVADLVSARAERAPTALIIEDLHWADASSLALLEHVAAVSRCARLLIVATSRIEPSVVVELPAGALRIDLEELPAPAAVEIVSDILGRHDLSDELAGLLLQKARGNPLFLQEVAFSLAGTETLDRLISASGPELVRQMAALEIPDRVQGLLMTRIDALHPQTKTVLRTAAVIGTTFERSTLEGVLGEVGGASDLDAEIESLLSQSLAEPEPFSAEPTFRFRHALIQEVAYDSLMFSKRRQLHVRIAEHLEGANAGDLEPLYESLVHHFSAGQAIEKTRVYAVKAAGKARRVFAHHEAVAYYQRAHASLGARTPEAAVFRSLLDEQVGDVLEVAGRAAEAALAYRDALRRWMRAVARVGHGPALTDANERLGIGVGVDSRAREAALCRKIGLAYARTYSDYDVSLDWLERAITCLPPRQPTLRAQIIVSTSNTLFRKGEYQRSLAQARHGMALARRNGDGFTRTQAMSLVANDLYETGNVRRSIAYDSASLPLYAGCGDLPGQALAYHNLGAGYTAIGMPDKALQHYRLALDIMVRIGNVKETGPANVSIAEVLVTRGEYDPAIAHLLDALAACDRSGGALWLRGFAHLNLSRAYQGKGMLEDARTAIEKSIECTEKAQTPGMLGEALLQRAALELEAGHTERALATSDLAVEKVRALGMRPLECRGLRIRGLALHALGDDWGAEESLCASVEMARSVESPLERGLGLLALAELRRDSADPAVRRPYRRTAIDAARIFERLGARPCAARARELAGACSPASSSRGSA